MTRFAIAPLLAAVASPVWAAPPDVPRELTAQPGQLVRIVAKSPTKIGVLRNFTDDAAFFDELAPKAGERRFVFQAFNPGQYVVGFFAVGEDEGSACTITVAGVPPKPPVPPTPLPDGPLGLIKASRDGLALVSDKTAAPKLAAAQRSHASACAAGAYADFAAALNGWREANRSAADAVAWAPWGTAVSAQLQLVYKAGKLPTAASWAAAFNEIATGLEAPRGRK